MLSAVEGGPFAVLVAWVLLVLVLVLFAVEGPVFVDGALSAVATVEAGLSVAVVVAALPVVVAAGEFSRAVVPVVRSLFVLLEARVLRVFFPPTWYLFLVVVARALGLLSPLERLVRCLFVLPVAVALYKVFPLGKIQNLFSLLLPLQRILSLALLLLQERSLLFSLLLSAARGSLLSIINMCIFTYRNSV